VVCLDFWCAAKEAAPKTAEESGIAPLLEHNGVQGKRAELARR